MDKRLTIEIDEQLKREFQSKCILEGKTIKEKIIDLILSYLANSKS